MNTPNTEPNNNAERAVQPEQTSQSGQPAQHAQSPQLVQPAQQVPSAQQFQPKNAAQLENAEAQSMTFGAAVPNTVRQNVRPAVNQASPQSQGTPARPIQPQSQSYPQQVQTQVPPNRQAQNVPPHRNMQAQYGASQQTRTIPRTIQAQNPNLTAARPAAKRKKRTKTWLIVLLSVLAVLIITAAVGVSLVYFYEPDADDEVPFNTGPAVTDDNGETQPLDFGEAPAQQSGKYTRRKGVYNFLVAGLDADGGNHTDVLLIVSYDTVNGSAAMLSIPRDTYINVGRNFSKLNSYYTGEYNVAVKNGLRGSEARKAAMDGLCKLLEENLAIKLDYWAMMDLEGFRNIVDIFGGVEIEIAEDMYYDDPFQNLHIDLKAGKQVLTGEMAEQFVRFRDGYRQADKGRINAQKVFITAFLDTVKRNISIGMLDDLIKEAATNVLTSINVLDCVYFAKMALTTLDLNSIYMVTLPSDGVQNTYTGAWYEVMFRADALAIINEHFNVYDREITDDIFDREGVFTNTEQEYIDKVYNRKEGSAEDGQSAGDIGESSVDIQRDAFLEDYID